MRVGFLSVVLPVCLAWAFADTELEVDSAELVTDDICSGGEQCSTNLLQVRAAKISAEMDPKIEDQEQSAQVMFKEQDQDSSSGLSMAEFTPSRPAVEQVQTNASGGCKLNACSSHEGFGPAACNKKPMGGVCPCPRKTDMHKAFVASWESSEVHQHEWNPVWGLLHMSVHNKECRPASGCDLVITLSFGHEDTSGRCAKYYPVSDVYFSDGDMECFNKFKDCFLKSPTGWHTVIAKGHSARDRHWKWMP